MNCNNTAHLSVPVSTTLSFLIFATTAILVGTVSQVKKSSADVIGLSLLQDEDDAGGDNNYNSDNSREGDDHL